MPHARTSPLQERTVKLVDVDATPFEPALDLSSDADTHASPGLRPEVLGDAAQRQTKAMVHAALFKVAGEATTIGPYQVLKLLGEGGMGVVYAAYDDTLERKVALKLIRGAAMRRPDGRARTLREARALARLSHPNVVHVYQVGEVDGEIYVAMEFLTGPTLRTWLAAKPRTWREVLAVFRQAGEGLAAAHRQGVIHRDFKPANVIVGDDGRVRVLDFGLAHFFGLDGEEGEHTELPAVGPITDVLLTQTGAVLGTPAYMAAEQFAGGRGDAKTDQFSFCTALYEALYGQRPFVGEQLDALALAVRDGRVKPVTTHHEVPPWLHRVVMRGLVPEPAMRWPSMDALLGALSPPETRTRWGRGAAITGGVGALLAGGVGLMFMLEAKAPAGVDAVEVAADVEARDAAQATVVRSQDATLLAQARVALAIDPVQTIRALTMLAGDDPETWQQARFIANAAEVRGLPTQVLRAEERLAELWPQGDGGLLGRDELGGVWQWSMPAGTATELLPAGAATHMVVARDVPVWAAIASGTVQVFGAERAQVIDIGDALYRDWRMAADGRTLVAAVSSRQAPWSLTLYLWDLTQPGTPPRTIALAPETLAVIADDVSVVLAREAKGVRVIRPREGRETFLKMRGQPWMLSADNKFVLVSLGGRESVMDVVELTTGKVRRVAAASVTVLAGSEVLFTQVEYGRPTVRRESLATGAVAWRLGLPHQAGQQERRLVVDAAHDQFAVAIGDVWGVGDLRRGVLRSFVAVPKDSSPQWGGAGVLMAMNYREVRLYRPAESPVQVRGNGSGCGLSPGGRFAVTLPWRAKNATYTRIDLTTGASTTFVCPTAPKTEDDDYFMAGVTGTVDDTGRVRLTSLAGWSCTWDEANGARSGTAPPTFGWHLALPHGFLRTNGAEVEVWSGPDDRAQRWTVAGPVIDLEVSPSGALLAVRSEQGVQVLHVDTGAAMAVNTWATPTGKAEALATTMAWSPDSTRLAVLDKAGGSLELSVWDVRGEPREILPPDHVSLSGRVLEDSPGRPRNRMKFTPGGDAVVLTNRHESLMRVELGTGQMQRIDTPEFYDLHMRSETDAVGISFDNVPVLIDFAARQVSPLTPDVEQHGATFPPMRTSANGSLWTCGALGAGTLTEIAAMDRPATPALRGHLTERFSRL